MVLVMVRAYILTERERELLARFVKTGEKLNAFTVLIHYLNKNEKTLAEDVELIRATMEKLKK
jgi:hypothetical protein